MKKLLSVIAISVAFVATAPAQSLLGGLLGGSNQSSDSTLSTLGNILTGLAGAVYSAPISLNGTYTYNGVACSASSSEGNVLTNLAGTAVTAGMESKADEYLAKVGIKPGCMTFTFNSEDNSFVLNCGPLSLPGTYKVGEGEKTVTLTFGKTMKFLCMTGTLESSLTGAKMLFTADKLLDFMKKISSKLGENSSQLKSITSLAEGYDQFRIGFKLVK
ncbi:MAG: DUF4923 family protein [Bacteroidales bacterium]|nr:DUF4923 family protein [Bacteroidales bacterium]MBR4735018.1 DUF4923 family protein [Bacteroidales bacterium]